MNNINSKWVDWLFKGAHSLFFILVLTTLIYVMDKFGCITKIGITNPLPLPPCLNKVQDEAKYAMFIISQKELTEIKGIHSIHYHERLKKMNTDLAIALNECDETVGDQYILTLMRQRTNIINGFVGKNKICPNHDSCIEQTPIGKCIYCKREWNARIETERKLHLIDELTFITQKIIEIIELKKENHGN